MDKKELAVALASRSHLNEDQALKFIDAFSETLLEYFKKGEKVVIAEFGSFYVAQDGTVQFNPSAKLKSAVSGE